MIQHEALLGPPGSGKTWYINEELKKNKRFGYKTASTGVAALIVTENNNEYIPGRTIHSTLGFLESIDLKESIENGKIFKRLKNISKIADRIIIDEISMLSGLVFDLIVYAVNHHNKSGKNIPLSILVTGDFLQLPHVGNEYPIFEGKFWNTFKVNKLTHIKRQENPEFIQVLDYIRKGKAVEVVDWVESNIGFYKHEDPDFNGTTIFPCNKDVIRFNNLKLDGLKGKTFTLYRKISGKPPSIASQVPNELNLKIDALVCIKVNNLIKGYANGSLAIVKEVDISNGYVVVQLISDNTYKKIEYITVENIEPYTKKKLGSITYMPLKIAFATTVHSCQGLTINGGLQCKLGDKFLTQLHGGLNVILSRCRNPFLLRLVGDKDKFIASNFIDKRYLNWS